MVGFACRPLLAGFATFVGLGLAVASPVLADSMNMQVSGWSNPPVGYVDFCRNFPEQCTAHGSDQAEALTEGRWRDLQEVNHVVNHSVSPVTDVEFYHRDEVWTLPDSYGDCEDYVLLKRKWLVERGWSTGALLISVVFDEVGDGHAVLLARTTRGDFVLDNKTDRVSRWYETAYHFVKRQSVSDPNRWVSVGDPRWTTQNTAASRAAPATDPTTPAKARAQ
jgi:predicted transglutaminase-like cysteine proteinase